MSHESIQMMLPLAAAGALTQEELSTVELHVGTCPGCRRELEVLRLYATGLQELPQPIVPVGLLSRTRARLVQERASKAERRWQALTLSLLVVFSWVSGIVFWLLVRAITGGVWKVFGTNLVAAGTWSLISGLLAWATAGVAVVILGKRNEPVRRIL
jgi:predicted anti-sigma-YlaC factor YlaD